MSRTRTRKACSAGGTLGRGEILTHASEIPVVLSPESASFFIAESLARSPEWQHASHSGVRVDCLFCFRSSLGGPSDRGLAAMTTFTKR
jgi:hypothetical protein